MFGLAVSSPCNMKKAYLRRFLIGGLVSLALVALYLVRSNANHMSSGALPRGPVKEVEPAEPDLVVDPSNPAARRGQMSLQQLWSRASGQLRLRLENGDAWYRLEAQAVLREFEAFRVSSGMSDEQYAALLGLVMDLRELGRSGGERMRDGEFRNAAERNSYLNKEAVPIRASIARLLGAETYENYARYVAVIPYERVANGYINSMSQRGCPLSDAAAQRITELYIEHHGLGDIRVDLTPDRLGAGAPIRAVQAALRERNKADAEIRRQASAFLDAAELKQLETHQRQRIAQIANAWKNRAKQTK